MCIRDSKSTDLPWINNRIRRLVRRRRAIFRQEGRGRNWRRQKKLTDDLIRKRRDAYFAVQKKIILADDGSRVFFKNVRQYKSADKPTVFDVRTLCPGDSDLAVAEKLAEYFNTISQEFSALEPRDIPITAPRILPMIEPWNLSKRIKKFKKPKSMVNGDIFPDLMTIYCDQLALPLADVYNEITVSYVWPSVWKHESVTVIPKVGHPSSFSDLRNISCTMLASKIYESFVLGWASEEVALKANQYGGVRGCSTAHMLIGVWDDICNNLEDYRAGTVLTSIDYAKAFNRVSYQQCLKALAKKGASSPVLHLIATFLSNRTMAVRVGKSWSAPRPVAGGCPQGSILGVFLFNATTDDLEDDFLRKEQEELPHDEYDVLPRTSGTWGSPRGADDGPVTPPGAPVDDVGTLPLTSTPEERRIGEPTRLGESPVTAGRQYEWIEGINFEFLPGARNVRPHHTSPPEEPNHWTRAAWKRKKVRCYKYVDDGLTVEKVNF